MCNAKRQIKQAQKYTRKQISNFIFKIKFFIVLGSTVCSSSLKCVYCWIGYFGGLSSDDNRLVNCPWRCLLQGQTQRPIDQQRPAPRRGSPRWANNQRKVEKPFSQEQPATTRQHKQRRVKTFLQFLV